MTETEFYDNYRPQQNHLEENAAYDGCLYETYGEQIEYARAMAEKERTWTIIEGENDSLWVVAGYRIVNRIGFFITEVPWPDVETEVCLFDGKFELEQDASEDTIRRALAGYIEDCAGEGSPEAEAIEEAWKEVSKLIRTEKDKRSWAEIHFEVVRLLMARQHTEKHHRDEQHGNGVLLEISIQITNDFEDMNKDKEWDGDIYDTIEEMVDKKWKETFI